MTVAELVAQLMLLPPKMPVAICDLHEEQVRPVVAVHAHDGPGNNWLVIDGKGNAGEGEVRHAGLEIGQRYRFTDFVGDSFEATLAGIESTDAGMRLIFEDRVAFTTNLPLSWEPAA
jgi:hypothetical protein